MAFLTELNSLRRGIGRHEIRKTKITLLRRKPKVCNGVRSYITNCTPHSAGGHVKRCRDKSCRPIGPAPVTVTVNFYGVDIQMGSPR
ncbi:hypothetical protein EVAR_2464_1 [Eumeta japonica]|uniref:Uncharacterized protein n=1 Tax=Eumeta variegata TaxID=151549 RepID=A0A4C1SQY5_EUMVA|nr:hypothetical protein EVAR_2464_1 [Eumeta japonica]